ncbi:hypothetical protein ES703_72847 [subsurface metagenome]
MSIRREDSIGEPMTEEKPRVQKVLAHLYDAEGTVRPKDIAESLSETPLNIGKDLHSLKERGLADTEGEGQWKITAEGREWLESGGGKAPGKTDEGKEPAVTIPTQADLFRDIGERLRIGIGRSGKQEGTPLDAIIYFTQKTANLDDLSSVWNALTEMGVANDVKKRWIKLYAQNLPGKEIPDDLKEKLEGGLEAEKVRGETGDITPKPKRFSVVGEEIIGDPEGDLTFKEAVQYLAQKKGASPAEAESLAIALSKQGPEMLTSIMGLITPLITKEPPAQDNTMILALQQRIEQLADAKHDAEMESLRAEMRTGTRSPEADALIQSLSQKIDDMKELIHTQEMARIQEQNQAIFSALNAKIDRLEAGLQGGRADTKVALLSEIVQAGKAELSGLRQDIKATIPLLNLGPSQAKQRTTSEKTRFSRGLEQGIGKAKAATALEDELFFGPQS